MMVHHQAVQAVIRRQVQADHRQEDHHQAVAVTMAMAHISFQTAVITKAI
jgi:hypothetical protein